MSASPGPLPAIATLASACLLAAAFLLSAVMAWGAATRKAEALFLSLLLFGAALAVPAACVVLLAGPVAAAIGLAIVFFPVLSTALRRLPRDEWHAARALGASPLLAFRVLVLPVLALPIGVVLALGVALLAVRHALGS